MAANPPIPSGMMCVASCRMPVSMPMPLVPLQPGYYMCFMLPAPAQYVHSIQSVHNAQVEEVPEKDSIVERFDLEDPGLDTTVEISAADVPTVDLLGAKVNSRAHGANKICDVDASFYTSDTETDVADAQSDAVLDAPPGLSLEAEPYRTPSELGLPPLLDRSAVELTRHGQMDVLDVADVEDADAPTLMPVSKCPSTWTLEETVSWMVGMEPALARCVPKLEENLIDGQVLQLLSEEDLISELGVPEHLCQAILDEIEKLFGECKNAQEVTLRFSQEYITPKFLDTDVLQDLSAEAWLPELSGQQLRVRDLPGFQKVYVRQSDVVEPFIIMTLGVSSEGRRILNFRNNELGYALMSQEQRNKYGLDFLSGPVVILKNPRFQVMKTLSPQSLKLTEFQKYIKGLASFDVSYPHVPPVRPTLSDFMPQESVPAKPLNSAPSKEASKVSARTPSAPPTAPPPEISREKSQDFPALPSQKSIAKSKDDTVKVEKVDCAAPPGLTRMNTVERTDAQLLFRPSMESIESVEKTAEGDIDLEINQVKSVSLDGLSPVSLTQLESTNLGISHEPIDSADAESCASTASTTSVVTASPISWTFDDVTNWLQSLDVVYIRYTAAFRENEVDGRCLKDLTMAELQHDLNVRELGPRKVIYAAIQKLFA